MRSWLRIGFVAAVAGWPAGAGAEPARFLPEAALRLEGARYIPAETDFQWTGWIGGGIAFLRKDRVSLLGSGDVETIIGNERRVFDANQANYHLETSLRLTAGRRDVSLFFNHVSRHAQDRPKPQPVDWNILGIRFAGPLAETPIPMRFLVSAGHTTFTSYVGYRFEAIARLEADLVRRPWGEVYFDAEIRGVTIDPTAEIPRDDFLDARAELGARVRRGARSAELFFAYEHRNDVYVMLPGARTRGLLGFRFGIDDRPPR